MTDCNGLFGFRVYLMILGQAAAALQALQSRKGAFHVCWIESVPRSHMPLGQSVSRVAIVTTKNHETHPWVQLLNFLHAGIQDAFALPCGFGTAAVS